MHKQPKDLSMPEDLRVGPQMRVSRDCEAERIAKFPVAEPGEMVTAEGNDGMQECMM